MFDETQHLSELVVELMTDSLKLGYNDPESYPGLDLEAGIQDGHIEARISAKTQVGLKAGSYVRHRTLYDLFDDLMTPDSIIEGLKSKGTTLSSSPDPQQQAFGRMLLRAYSWMEGQNPEDGIDVGRPAVRALVDQCVAIGIMTKEQATKIKVYGELPISRAEELWGQGSVVSHIAINHARRAI